MSQKEVTDRIAVLTREQKEDLYRLCGARRRKNGTSADVAVYEAISPDVAEVLYEQRLVWLIGSMLAAVRHDVYAYWLKHVYRPELQPVS